MNSPPYPIDVLPETDLRTFYLQDIQAVRGQLPFEESSDLEATLTNAASALGTAGERILAGDFSDFVAASELIKRRAAQRE